MKRRQLLTYGAGLIALTSVKSATAADGAVDYSRETFDKALADGKPFMLDFYASW